MRPPPSAFRTPGLTATSQATRSIASTRPRTRTRFASTRAVAGSRPTAWLRWPRNSVRTRPADRREAAVHPPWGRRFCGAVRRLGIMDRMTDGPLIVQSDKTVLLEVDHGQAGAARAAI